MVNVFAVPVFFICFRECLETSIIVSVLLAFLKQTLGPEQDSKVYKSLVKQVWWGTGIGIAICIATGAALIGVFYALDKKAFEKAEHIWEGVFGLVAAVIISVMGAALLRVNKLQEKWRVKMAKAMEARDGNFKAAGGGFKAWAEKYAMFILPFITVLREGLEAVLFIGGVGVGLPASAFPIAVLSGLAAGAVIGYLIYRGGNVASLQVFLIISTCFLYLVGAGLFSKGVNNFEIDAWIRIVGQEVQESGEGPGSYDIRKSVWHVNCCAPSADNGGGGWGVFNSLFGWTNSATYGSVISYNLYWIAVIITFLYMHYSEQKGTKKGGSSESSSTNESSGNAFHSGIDEKGGMTGPITENVREIKV